MSSLRSFFNSRRAQRNFNNKTERITLSDNTKHVAVQAPQPVYDSLPKSANTTTIIVKKKSMESKQNSILNYLSFKKNTNVVDKNESEDIQICKIRKSIPMTNIWNIIMEEFDSQSQTNQLHGTPIPSEDEEDILEDIEVGTTALSNKRIRKQENMSRNVRTRNNAELSINTYDQDDYLIDDVEENLSRPLRCKRNLEETNAFLLHIADEFLALSDNRCFQIKAC
ncbi:uncharacterized protein BX663DRAFT_486022 [Cokeromyces recurvatus]|uniref:uncharacterized protein n=1 Tax=Cokeromyces recurvatus TaxID=90255 RepID=UPI00221F658C|nr:uncharacterized protein BX663DRAFT_486022 [Cokeromyces recurvatus]KAI7903294.1 hypothetical protein BX663DRAFT_486022 [Cokeromyces recurvatus]